jgi:hypothetical protein
MNGKPKRQSTGKRLRFEVFKRDFFTCQYCGQQPPAVVLVVDHIDPVAAGGASTIDNLISACEACNQGKADKPLGERAVRPDADVLYLQTQQEIAEMRRYRESLAEYEVELTKTVESLQDLWQNVSGADWAPAPTLLRQLLSRYSVDVVGEALGDVAAKVGGGYLPSAGTRWVRYLWSTAKNLAVQAGDVEAE